MTGTGAGKAQEKADQSKDQGLWSHLRVRIRGSRSNVGHIVEEGEEEGGKEEEEEEEEEKGRGEMRKGRKRGEKMRKRTRKKRRETKRERKKGKMKKETKENKRQTESKNNKNNTKRDVLRDRPRLGLSALVGRPGDPSVAHSLPTIPCCHPCFVPLRWQKSITHLLFRTLAADAAARPHTCIAHGHGARGQTGALHPLRPVPPLQGAVDGGCREVRVDRTSLVMLFLPESCTN